jgi:hypothetical protein
MFQLHRGKTKIMYFKGDTALQVRDGGAVSLTDSATLTPARNDSTDRIIGIARRNDTTTDSAMVPVEVPVETAVEWLIDVDSDAGAADSDIGRYCAIDTVGGGSVLAGDSAGMRIDVSDTTIRQVFITGRVSATKVIGVINRLAFNVASPDTAGNA